MNWQKTTKSLSGISKMQGLLSNGDRLQLLQAGRMGIFLVTCLCQLTFIN
ncbi:MAG TPA: hypothetical protein VN726_14160 [Hanamia sp.]|nr:hypothetical protein [Hanamia sp.]